MRCGSQVHFVPQFGAINYYPIPGERQCMPVYRLLLQHPPDLELLEMVIVSMPFVSLVALFITRYFDASKNSESHGFSGSFTGLEAGMFPVDLFSFQILWLIKEQKQKQFPVNTKVS